MKDFPKEKEGGLHDFLTLIINLTLPGSVISIIWISLVLIEVVQEYKRLRNIESYLTG
jgi:hypothetical protein